MTDNVMVKYWIQRAEMKIMTNGIKPNDDFLQFIGLKLGIEWKHRKRGKRHKFEAGERVTVKDFDATRKGCSSLAGTDLIIVGYGGNGFWTVIPWHKKKRCKME